MSGFFDWGIAPLEDEVERDLAWGMAQPKRSLFYNRDYGCGVVDRENQPVTVGMLVQLKADVASFFATRNSRVSDGSGGTRDRRAVTSQSSVRVGYTADGEVGVEVDYISIADLSALRTVAL